MFVKLFILSLFALSLQSFANQDEPAYEIAQDLESEKSFSGEKNKDTINKTIEALQVLLSVKSNLPDSHQQAGSYGKKTYEIADQMKLNSFYSLTAVYYRRFIKGVKGQHISRLFQSSDTGDKNINVHSEYSPHTLDSLDQVIKYGKECQNLPKKQHFNPVRYNSFKESCRIYTELAQTLRPLELKRLTVLDQESCQKDLNKTSCPEYFEVINEILNLVDQSEIAQEAALRPLHTQAN